MATVTFSTQPTTIRYKADGGGQVIMATLLPGIDETVMFSALVDGIMYTSRQPATYRELQATLKAAGLKASGKCEVLRRTLHEAQARKAREFEAHWTSQLTVRNRKVVTPAPAPEGVATPAPAPEAPAPDLVESFDCFDTANTYTCPEEEPDCNDTTLIETDTKAATTIKTGTIRDLKALAKETKLPRYGRLRKAELQSALALHLGVAL